MQPRMPSTAAWRGKYWVQLRFLKWGSGGFVVGFWWIYGGSGWFLVEFLKVGVDFAHVFPVV